VAKVLRKHGFVKADQAGSHMKFIHPDSRIVIVPRHDVLDTGTLKSILDQARISRNEFLREI
jgi:predicted RNA binding protein YcfA (HicA-like mRNA interferase family)